MIKFESEKHFENYLKDHLPKLLPDKFQFQIDVAQQVKLDGYGICDLLFRQTIKYKDDDSNTKEEYIYTLVEVKNEPLKYSHFGQVARYKKFFDKCFMSDESDMRNVINVEYMLISPYHHLGEIADADVCFLAESSSEWLSTYMLSIDHEKVYLSLVEGWYRKNSGYVFSLIDSQIDNKKGCK